MDVRKLFKFIFPDAQLNRSLRILLTTNTILAFVLGMFAPFYAIFIQRLGGTIAFVGLSWGLFLIVSGVLTLMFSRWGMQVKEQELLIAFGYLLRGLVFLSYAFMYSISQLIFTQIIWGAAVAFGGPAFDVVYAKHTDSDNSLIQWGEWEGLSSISNGLAALVGGIILQSFGFTAIFILMSSISFGLSVYIWRLPREAL